MVVKHIIIRRNDAVAVPVLKTVDIIPRSDKVINEKKQLRT